MAPEREVVVLSPDGATVSHVRALLEQDGYKVTEARDPSNARDLVLATRARTVLVDPRLAAAIEPLRAELERCRPDVDVLPTPGFGHALLDGALDRKGLACFARDVLSLAVATLERESDRAQVAERAAELAELTATRLGLGRLQVETCTTAALLLALGPLLARSRFGADSKDPAAAGMSRELHGALAAAALLRGPYRLIETLGATEERFDGRGRPNGLSGAAVPPAAAVAALAVEYARTTSDSEGDWVKALQRIEARGGKTWDRAVVTAFSRVLRDYGPAQAPGKGPTVVVVDSDPASLAVAELRLAGAGFRVKAYLDGRAAEAAIFESPPDAVVSEIVLPRFDGLSLLARVRRDPFLGTLPFFVLSVATDRRAVTRALKLGATDVMAKPACFDVLAAKLSEATRARQEAERTRTLEGNLGELSLAGILRLLATTRRTATVHVESGRVTGLVGLERGEPAVALAGDLEGSDALCLLLSCREGRFSVEPATGTHAANLRGALETLLAEAARREHQVHAPPAGAPADRSAPAPRPTRPLDRVQSIARARTVTPSPPRAS